MTHVAPATPGQDLSDRVVSYLRTMVPGAWAALVGSLLAWLSPHLPGDVVGWLGGALGSEAAVAIVVAAALAGWYWLWRRLEPRVPAWLIRLVLGSSKAPVYGVNVVTLTDAEVADAASLRDALDEGDPTRSVLERILLAHAA